MVVIVVAVPLHLFIYIITSIFITIFTSIIIVPVFGCVENRFQRLHVPFSGDSKAVLRCMNLYLKFNVHRFLISATRKSCATYKKAGRTVLLIIQV